MIRKDLTFIYVVESYWRWPLWRRGPGLQSCCTTHSPTIQFTASGCHSSLIERSAAHNSVLCADDDHYIPALSLPSWSHILMEHYRATEWSSNVIKSEWNPIYYDDSQREHQLGMGHVVAEYWSVFGCKPIRRPRYEMQSLSWCALIPRVKW